MPTEPTGFISVTWPTAACTAAGLVEDMRQKKYAYASLGDGSLTQLLGQAFAQAAGSVLQEKPYAGLSAALADLIAGRVHIMFLPTGVAKAALESRQLKLLGLVGSKRKYGRDLTAFPVSESLPAFRPPSLAWSIHAPSGTPAAVVARLSTSLAKAVAREAYLDTAQKLDLNHFTPQEIAQSRPGVVALAAAREKALKIRISQAISPDVRELVNRIFGEAVEEFKDGHYEAAVRGFKRGLDLDPANGIAHYYLAATYLRQEKTDEAQVHYRATIDFAPDTQQGVMAQAALKAM